MANSTISYLWRDQERAARLSHRRFAAQPHQPVQGDPGFSGQLRQPVSGDASRCSRGWSAAPRPMHGVRVNYAASYWTPPMTPKLAFDLESAAD